MIKGSTHTAETARKMSASQRRRWARANMPRTCTQDACLKDVLAKGLCSMHYSRVYRYGSLARPVKRPWNKGKKTGVAPWLGKKRGPHSPETRAKMSAAHSGRPKSPAHAAKILERQWHFKMPRPVYAGIAFRSTYEVRFAKALDARRVEWRYEPRRFNLGTCSYLPDFYLPGLAAYIEAKGYFSPESQAKVGLFRARHPELPLVVVTRQTLERLEQEDHGHGSRSVEDHLGLAAR